MRMGIVRIADERQRQIDKHGWTAEHDADHNDGDLINAAICYAAPERIYFQRQLNGGPFFCDPWPEKWEYRWDKRPRFDTNDGRDGELKTADDMTKDERIRCLEKAGALIAAEIDRLLAAE